MDKKKCFFLLLLLLPPGTRPHGWLKLKVQSWQRSTIIVSVSTLSSTLRHQHATTYGMHKRLHHPAIQYTRLLQHPLNTTHDPCNTAQSTNGHRIVYTPPVGTNSRKICHHFAGYIGQYFRSTGTFCSAHGRINAHGHSQVYRDGYDILYT